MSKARSERYVFLDVLRALAVLWMIQVHITNVVLGSSLKSGWWYNILNLSNGFVAPAFIFCAGIGLYIALSRKGEAYLAWDRSLWEYLRRLSYILFWAYMFHVPVFAISRFPLLSAERLQSWLQLDVLHTIVYTSIGVLAGFFVLRDIRKAAIACGIVALMIFVGTVFVWKSLPMAALPFWVTYALSNSPPSTFPLLPWSGYLLAGVFFSHLFFHATNKSRLALWLICVGVLLPLPIFYIHYQPFASVWDGVWWQSSPGVHGFRLSGLLLAFGLLFLAEQWLKRSWIGKNLQIVGMESLFLYLSHLQIVYGYYTPTFLADMGLADGNYLTVFFLWIGLTIPLLVAMYAWHRFKKLRPTLARYTLGIQVAITVLLFLFR